MLSYLLLCAVSKVVVLEYEDHAGGTVEGTPDGGGRFIRITLRPQITLAAQSNLETAQRLHHDAHEKCFIATP
jgi:organic hydroperoxide reductase OsmC/OhrA